MKIYIISPYLAAGGVESLHQLCDACNSQNIEAYMCYYFDDIIKPIPNYSHYNIQTISKKNIEDIKDNWIIIPEYCEWVWLLDAFKNINKAYWWLSVDNNGGKFTKFNDNSILHLYQSHYAMAHLLNNNAKYYMPMFDYINTVNIDKTQKEDIICYNPAKDKTTPTLASSISYDLVPLANMNYSEIIRTLNKSKMYIDLGNHPGRDRLPRESALLNNIVVTNKKGAAYFYNDITIPIQYKSNKNEDIINTVQCSMKNYETSMSDFDVYKKILKNQKSEVYLQAKNLFG